MSSKGEKISIFASSLVRRECLPLLLQVSVPSYPWLSSSLVEDLEVIPRLVTRDGKKAIEVSSLAEGVTKWTVHKVEEGGIKLLATKPR